MTLSPVLLYLEEDGVCFIMDLNTGDGGIFSQSVSLTQYEVLSVCLSVRLFQLASELSGDIIARRCSDYCPRGVILI